MNSMTTQLPINATASSSLVIAADNGRRFLYLRNYTASSQTMWIAFANPATPGTNGELELPAGQEMVFGGKLEANMVGMPTSFQQNCPVEAVYVITTAGVATGCLLAY